MSIHEAYDPATRWGRAFGFVDRKNYAPPKYEHRGQDIRTLHSSGAYSISAPVVSLTAGRISHRYEAKSTGLEIVVDTGRKRGRYEIHCHCADAAPVGTHVDAGGRVARNAVLGEKTGTGWGGPHDHFVISDYPDAAHVPSRPVYDPREFIRTALTTATTAGTTATKPETVEQSEEDTMKDLILTVGVAEKPGAQQQYWAMNLADNTIALIPNGTQLEFRRNLGIREVLNQPPAVIAGFRRTT